MKGDRLTVLVPEAQSDTLIDVLGTAAEAGD